MTIYNIENTFLRRAVLLVAFVPCLFVITVLAALEGISESVPGSFGDFAVCWKKRP